MYVLKNTGNYLCVSPHLHILTHYTSHEHIGADKGKGIMISSPIPLPKDGAKNLMYFFTTMQF